MLPAIAPPGRSVLHSSFQRHSILHIGQQAAHLWRVDAQIDSGYGMQIPEVWLLQVWMGPSMGGFNPVALDLLDICQVSVPPGRATRILAWLSVWLELAILDLQI